MKSLLLLTFVFFGLVVSVFSQEPVSAEPSLWIDLVDTRLEENADTTSIEALLHIMVTNNSNRKLLLLDKPAYYWGKDIYRKEPDGTYSVIYHQPGGNSYFDRSQKRKELMELKLPSNKIQELRPGESLMFDESVFILIFKNNNYPGGAKIFEKDLKHLSSVWLSIGRLYWDPNLDLDLKTMKKLDFSEQLKERWSDYGLLWTQPIESNLLEIPLPKNVLGLSCNLHCH